MEFKNWIEKKFYEWRGDTRTPLREFADYVGVSQQVMSNWINGNRTPNTYEHIMLLALIYKDIFDVLEIQRPPFDLEGSLSSFPLEYRQRFVRAYSRYNDELTRKGIEIDSPEARKIVNEAFASEGIQFTSKDGSS